MNDWVPNTFAEKYVIDSLACSKLTVFHSSLPQRRALHAYSVSNLRWDREVRNYEKAEDVNLFLRAGVGEVSH